MKFNRPQIHFSSKNGWINDPNGCIYYKGLYHIFFQHNKHSLNQENICWGHAVSKDLINFEELDDALVNDKQYDKIGIWSGGSIVFNDKLYLIYTSFGYDENNNQAQTISIAYSSDGINFIKHPNNPVIRNINKPDIASKEDFRDPFIFKKNDKFYVIIGSKNPKKNLAMILLYETKDLINYKYIDTLAIDDSVGTMFECPSIIEDNDKAILIMSPQNLTKNGFDFDNISSSIYQVTDKNYLNDKIKLDNYYEIDHGCEFYAPLMFSDDKRKLLIAWNNMWGRRYIHQDYNLSWCGNLTIPREINILGNRLKSKPIKEVDNYLSNVSSKTINMINDHQYEIVNNLLLYRLRLAFEKNNNLILKITLHSLENEYVNIIFDYINEEVTFDRSNLKEKLNGLESNSTKDGIRKCKLNCSDIDILFDEHILEIFFNEYFDSMTNLICMDFNKLTITSNIDCKLTYELRKK